MRMPMRMIMPGGGRRKSRSTSTTTTNILLGLIIIILSAAASVVLSDTKTTTPPILLTSSSKMDPAAAIVDATVIQNMGKARNAPEGKSGADDKRGETAALTSEEEEKGEGEDTSPTEAENTEDEMSGETFVQDRLSDLKIIDDLLQTYDRRATPTNKIGQPTEVGCELFIRSFGSISEKTMDYQVDLYLRQHWEDPRLNHAAIKEALDLNDPKLVQAIWKPEVYFPNAKEGEFQYVTVPNVLLRIKPNGQILYMLRLKMKFSCMMELGKYPLDVQTCTMEVASFSKTTRELLLEWNKENPVDLSNDVKLPQFIVTSVVTDHCEESSLIGNYSCLVAKFHLSRSIGFHMVQSYVPTILIVVISWVSFWMDVDSVPGRTTLGVTTLLTVSSKSAGLNAETPQVSYVKAIDVWMGACTAFIFAALIEFTFVNYLWRRSRLQQQHRAIVGAGSGTGSGRRGFCCDCSNVVDVDGFGDDDIDGGSAEKIELSKTAGDNGLLGRGENDGHQRGRDANSYSSSKGGGGGGGGEDASGGGGGGCRHDERFRHGSKIGLRIDEACRVLFPLNFIGFNIFYWWYYLSPD